MMMNLLGIYICPCCGKRSKEYGVELNNPYYDSYLFVLHIHCCPYCDFISVIFRGRL